ncbi:DUF1631 domain-containing protein [Marinobacter sp. 1Y8]
MTNDNRVVNLHKTGGERSFTLPSALIRLRDFSGQSLTKELSEFFDSADDALFNMADKAGSNQDQAAYFDAMRELRLRRKSMTLTMLQWVARAFNELGKFDPRPANSSLTDVNQDNLSLVDHGELEQQVAIDNLITKLRNRHLDAIRMLVTRFQHLVPSASLEDRQMPLSPEVICGGLQEACDDLDIDIRAKLVVLKLFDKLLISRLDGLYRDANALLVKDGVLPDLTRAPVGAPKGTQRTRAEPAVPTVTTRAPVPPSSASTAQGNGAGAGDGAIQTGQTRATFSELSALLHSGDQNANGQGAGHSVNASQNSGAGASLDTRDLMRRLSQLQQTAAANENDTAAVTPGSLTSQIESVLDDRAQGISALNQVDADVVNLVTMLFDFILEDRHLPVPMKTIIGRLQIPMLKVALLDRSFFNRGGHPARKLLNELAMAGIGWNEKSEGQRDPLREKIESVSDRLLRDFTDNVDIFPDLLSEFAHFMDLDRRRRELIEQRLRDAEEGRARQERARAAAGEVLARVTENRTLPSVMKQLLAEPWSKVLQFLYLREGEGSEGWNNAVTLAERLVWSVDPQPVTDQTRSELLRRIPAIVDDLRKGLHSVSWDPFASDALVHDLELAHVDTLQQLALEAAPRKVAPAAKVEPEPEPEPQAQPEAVAPEIANAIAEMQADAKASQPVAKAAPAAPSAEPEVSPEPVVTAEPLPVLPVEPVQAEAPPVVDTRWLEMAEKLRVGSWVELVKEDQKTRCKLAAVIKATGKYIFVNRNGAKVAEYNLADVAAALETGEVHMLDDGLIFDRALESIIDNLRHSRKD